MGDTLKIIPTEASWIDHLTEKELLDPDYVFPGAQPSKTIEGLKDQIEQAKQQENFLELHELRIDLDAARMPADGAARKQLLQRINALLVQRLAAVARYEQSHPGKHFLIHGADFTNDNSANTYTYNAATTSLESDDLEKDSEMLAIWKPYYEVREIYTSLKRADMREQGASISGKVVSPSFDDLDTMDESIPTAYELGAGINVVFQKPLRQYFEISGYVKFEISSSPIKYNSIQCQHIEKGQLVDDGDLFNKPARNTFEVSLKGLSNQKYLIRLSNAGRPTGMIVIESLPGKLIQVSLNPAPTLELQQRIEDLRAVEPDEAHLQIRELTRIAAENASTANHQDVMRSQMENIYLVSGKPDQIQDVMSEWLRDVCGFAQAQELKNAITKQKNVVTTMNTGLSEASVPETKSALSPEEIKDAYDSLQDIRTNNYRFMTLLETLMRRYSGLIEDSGAFPEFFVRLRNSLEDFDPKTRLSAGISKELAVMLYTCDSADDVVRLVYSALYDNQKGMKLSTWLIKKNWGKKVLTKLFGDERVEENRVNLSKDYGIELSMMPAMQRQYGEELQMLIQLWKSVKNVSEVNGLRLNTAQATLTGGSPTHQLGTDGEIIPIGETQDAADTKQLEAEG